MQKKETTKEGGPEAEARDGPFPCGVPPTDPNDRDSSVRAARSIITAS